MNNLDLGTTAFVFGSGAVVDSWDPICDALRLYFRIEQSKSDAANFLLSHIVYGMRTSMLDFIDAKQRNIKAEEFSQFKRMICDSLADYTSKNTLKPRSEFDDIFELVIRNSTHIAAITTNWDTCVDNAIKKWCDISVLHVHGIYSDPSSLFLPNEIIYDNYRDIALQKKFEAINIKAATILCEAKTIVIYGLSMSPLDVELAQIFYRSFIGTEIETILIIDPEAAKVAERIQFTFDNNCQWIDLIPCKPDEIGLLSYDILHRKRTLKIQQQA